MGNLFHFSAAVCVSTSMKQEVYLLNSGDAKGCHIHGKWRRTNQFLLTGWTNIHITVKSRHNCRRSQCCLRTVAEHLVLIKTNGVTTELDPTRGSHVSNEILTWTAFNTRCRAFTCQEVSFKTSI